MYHMRDQTEDVRGTKIKSKLDPASPTIQNKAKVSGEWALTLPTVCMTLSLDQ